jgi:CRP-like cAMP-binding protein
MRPTPRVSPSNFLAGLSPSHFEVFRSLMRPVDLKDGECLFAQGEEAGGAWFVDGGKLELTVTLSGGAEVHLATARPGEIVGELGLLTDIRRTCTATASADTRLLAVDRLHFRGLLGYFHPASLAVMKRLTLLVGERVRDTTERLCPGCELFPAGGAVEDPPGTQDEARVAFDPRPFLSHLAFFSPFTPEERQDLLSRCGSTYWTLPRGRQLGRNGAGARSAWIVVRGAVERVVRTDAGPRRLAVYGPGAIVGELSILLDEPRTAALRVREDAVLLEVPGEVIRELADDEPVSFAFYTAVVRQLASRLAEINRLVVRDEQWQTASPSLPTVGARNPSARVLVVDDSALNRGVITSYLDDLGHRWEEAGDGVSALQKLEAEPDFDIILLDVRMPGLDGYQTLEAIKTTEPIRSIPVVMITAVDSLESAIRCLRLGAEDYLPRTFDEDMLEARIQACLDRPALASG